MLTIFFDETELEKEESTKQFIRLTAEKEIAENIGAVETRKILLQRLGVKDA